MEWIQSSFESHEEARIVCTLIGYLIRERALTRSEIHCCLERQLEVMTAYLNESYEKYDNYNYNNYY